MAAVQAMHFAPAIRDAGAPTSRKIAHSRDAGAPSIATFAHSRNPSAPTIRKIAHGDAGAHSSLKKMPHCACGRRNVFVGLCEPNFRRVVASSGVCRAAAVSVEPTALPTKPVQQGSVYEITTFTTWLLKQEQGGVIDGELTIVLSSIALACKQIASLVQRAGISNLTGLHVAANIQGEDQKKLDVVSNEIFSSCLRSSGRTGIIASEEEDTPVAVEESYSGNYIVVFDPLDGSSNVDTAVSTGSIFGIYEPNQECLTDLGDDPSIDEVAQSCVLNVCQPGNNLLSAGYCMYSSSVILVLSVGHGVYGFTLDPLFGEFVLSHEEIQIPKAGKIYSFNEGNYALWDAKLQSYVDSLKEPGSSGKPYSSRYIGSMVGDFHRTMLYGGIYGYPKDAKSKTGKLRLLYECAPMSYLAEQAGGKGSDGHQRILDIQPDQVHQRVPLYIGSTEEVEKLESFLA